MKRLALFVLTAIATWVACESPSEKQADARRETDRKISQIESEKDQKIDDAKRKAADEAEKASRDAEEREAEVRQAAERRSTGPEKTVRQEKIDLRTDREKTLADLDRDAANLKADLEKRHSMESANKAAEHLKAVSDAVRQSIDDIEPSIDLEVARKRVDDRIDDYKKALKEERKNL